MRLWYILKILFKKVLKKIVPRKIILGLRGSIGRIYYFGNRFFCPCCGGHLRKMKPFEGLFYINGKQIDYYTENSICPICSSDIRHRFLLTFLKNNTNILKTELRLLHFAPEEGISRFFKKLKNIDYVPCDIDPSGYPGALKVDITHMQFASNSFGGVLASHVLEHVKDDLGAIKEIYRIVESGGWALIAIPVYGESTFEDLSLDYSGREKMYGIGCHMRMNGLDFRLKLSEAGFHVNVFSLDDAPGSYFDRSANSPHIDTDKYLFFCNKVMT